MPAPEDFWSYFAAVATYVAVLAVPGGVVGWAAGLRGWALAGLAPLLSYAITGLAGPWLAIARIPYGSLSVAAVTLLLAAVLSGLRRLAMARGWLKPDDGEPAWTRRAHLAVAACVTIAVAVSIVVVVTGRGGTTAVFQRWDTVFHANGIRYIAETGDGSLTGMGTINWYPGGSFYPNAYHLVGALVYELSGTSIPVTLNAITMPIAGLFALAMAALVRQLGGRAVFAGSAALVAGGATTGAYESVSSGLLPFALGIVLTPLAVIALQRFLARPGADSGAVLALSATGLLAAHSSALFGAILFAFPLVVQRWYRALRGRLFGGPGGEAPGPERSSGCHSRRVDGVPEGTRAWRVVGGDVLRMLPVMVVAGVIAAPMIFGAIGFTSGSYPYHAWGSHMPVWKALAMLATFKQVLPVPQIWLTVFLAVGVLTLVALRRMRWLVLSALGLSALFVVVACFGGEDWVISLSRPWWNDRFRLMALASIPMCLLAAHGMSETQRWLAKQASGRAWVRARPWLTGRVGLATAVLLVVAMGVLTGGFYRAANAKTVSLLYYNGLPGEVVPPVSQDEIDAMDHLGTLGIPADQKVLNDRLDGTAWMYALTGVHPVAGHYDAGVAPPDALYLARHFADFDSDPQVRAAVQRLNIHYVLIGSGTIRRDTPIARGLQHLDGHDFLRVVYRNPGAVIYRIVK
ncbi:DUF6541 family protein [Amycolatopsis plumensis]|uniref:DUF6541 family protein n=1 Tax=Amycolatopsis plumensis TaxID=236508 RepID=A0ABV5U9L9_9PSEU